MPVAAGLLALSCGFLLGLVRAYDVAPVSAAWNGWTRRGDAISEVIVCNFDSLAYIELFADGTGNGGDYTAGVYEDNKLLTSSVGNKMSDHHWIRFADWNETIAFGRSRKYEVRFTRSGGDSIQFFCDCTDPYHDGWMIAPNRHSMPNTSDLAMRCYGRLKLMDSRMWGATCIIPGNWQDPLPRHLWGDSMKTSGAKWGTIYMRWNQLEPRHDTFDFWDLDAHIRAVAETSGLEPVGILQWSPKWASTRVDWIWEDTTPGVPGDSFWKPETSVYAAPRGLADNDTAPNYWTLYLDSLLDHFDVWEQVHGHRTWRPGDSIHTWCIWSESNEGATTWVHGDSYPGYTGAWRRPNVYYDVSSDVHDMCSLYVRLCVEAAKAIRSHPKHAGDRIVIGELARVNFKDDAISLVPGKEWLRAFYDIADRETSRFWNVVSVHPYQTHSTSFDPNEFAADVETLRMLMQEHNDTAQLWNTEFNYGLRDNMSGQDNANSLGEAYVSLLAYAGSPGGTYDRACWWLSWTFPGSPVWTLLYGDTMTPNPNYYALRQTARMLPGKRFNSRVMDGDTAIDNHTRAYEFENPATHQRTWACWRDANAKGELRIRLPVRTNQLVAESLAYSKMPPRFSPPVVDDGWLYLGLNSRPVFISEKTAPRRPDLGVDSLRYERSGKLVRAWVTNHGNRSTPVRSGAGTPYPTWALLRANGDSLAQAVKATSVAAERQTEFAFDLGQTRLPDTVLFSVTVNPGQTYVELGMDDNAGYTLVVKP